MSQLFDHEAEGVFDKPQGKLVSEARPLAKPRFDPEVRRLQEESDQRWYSDREWNADYGRPQEIPLFRYRGSAVNSVETYDGDLRLKLRAFDEGVLESFLHLDTEFIMGNILKVVERKS